MTTIMKKHLIKEAHSLLTEAKNELARPEEDVVSYTVCDKAYTSVRKFLMHYLEDNQIDLPGNNTLQELIQVCKEFNPKFLDLDFEPMLNFREKEDIWADITIAHLYLDLAEKTRDLVTE